MLGCLEILWVGPGWELLGGGLPRTSWKLEIGVEAKQRPPLLKISGFEDTGGLGGSSSLVCHSLLSSHATSTRPKHLHSQIIVE